MKSNLLKKSQQLFIANHSYYIWNKGSKSYEYTSEKNANEEKIITNVYTSAHIRMHVVFLKLMNCNKFQLFSFNRVYRFVSHSYFSHDRNRMHFCRIDFRSLLPSPLSVSEIYGNIYIDDSTQDRPIL